MTSNVIVRRAAGRLALCFAAALGIAIISPAPGQAQWFGYGDAPIPPGAIVRSLIRQGFIDIGAPRFDGSVYVVDGINARGARVRLVIDGYDGAVLSRIRLERPIMPPRDVGPSRGRAGDPFEEEADAFDPPRPAPWTERYDPREAELPRRVERLGPVPDRKTARAEPPSVRNPGAPTQSVRPAESEPPRVAPAAPPSEAAEPKARPADKPSSRAAVAPSASSKPEAKPVSPAAPKPKADQPKSSGAPEPKATEAPASSRSVRVIEGVTPVLPQGSAPPKVTVETPPEIVPPVTLE
jgi:hypothetical protein